MHVTTALKVAGSVRLQSKHSLKTIIPSIFVSNVPRVAITSSVPTAPYNVKDENKPLLKTRPYHIIHDPSLAERLMSSLHKYLKTSPRGNDRPSTILQHFVDFLPTHINHTSTCVHGLIDETCSTNFWGCFDQVISAAVQQIDQKVSVPGSYQSQVKHSQSPDRVIFSSSTSGPRILREDKSPSVFNRHASKIVDMGKGDMDGLQGSPLSLEDAETSHRSILLKIAVSMISYKDGPIPYAILFGGDRFMLFSLFDNVGDDGEKRFGLFCSDIIKTSSKHFPIIPLTIFMLLGKDGCAPLNPSQIPIPPVGSEQNDKEVRKQRTTKQDISQLLQNFSPKQNILKMNFDADSPFIADAVFVLSRQPSTRQYSTTPDVRLPRFTTQKDSQFHNTHHFGSVALCPPADVGSNPHPTSVPIADLPSTVPHLRLTDLIGEGATGYVYSGTAEDGSRYAVKVALFKDGKEMLSNEAFIYDRLTQLQGECVPRMFGLFSCEYFDAMVMEFVGRTAIEMEDVSLSQRYGLFQDLCHIHENGVWHGDLRTPNVAIPEGCRPRFMDFSHSSLHDCKGPDNCDELIEAHDFFLLNESE